MRRVSESASQRKVLGWARLALSRADDSDGRLKETSVDREVHATSGQDADATTSCRRYGFMPRGIGYAGVRRTQRRRIGVRGIPPIPRKKTQILRLRSGAEWMGHPAFVACLFSDVN